MLHQEHLNKGGFVYSEQPRGYAREYQKYKTHSNNFVVLFIASWLLGVHEANLYSDALDGAFCGNHVCNNLKKEMKYMNNYQNKEHVYKYVSVATATSASFSWSSRTGILLDKR